MATEATAARKQNRQGEGPVSMATTSGSSTYWGIGLDTPRYWTGKSRGTSLDTIGEGEGLHKMLLAMKPEGLHGVIQESMGEMAARLPLKKNAAEN